jgi:hypothetical protein
VVENDRHKVFGRGIETLDGSGESTKVMPQVVPVDVFPPVPTLSRSGSSGEERREHYIVENDAGAILRIELERTSVARFDGAGLGQDHGTIRGTGKDLPDRVGRQDVHRAVTHIEARPQIQVTMHLRDVVTGHRGQSAIQIADSVRVVTAEALHHEVLREEFLEVA